jgi:hypothetical protein
MSPDLFGDFRIISARTLSHRELRRLPAVLTPLVTAVFIDGDSNTHATAQTSPVYVTRNLFLGFVECTFSVPQHMAVSLDSLLTLPHARR